MELKVVYMDLSILHRKQWIWCSENPEYSEAAWPEWIKNGGTIDYVVEWCFACEAADHQRVMLTDNRCQFCPLWPIELGSGCQSPSANTLYYQWFRGTVKDRAALARKIAEMPWEDRRRYPIVISC